MSTSGSIILTGKDNNPKVHHQMFTDGYLLPLVLKNVLNDSTLWENQDKLSEAISAVMSVCRGGTEEAIAEDRGNGEYIPLNDGDWNIVDEPNFLIQVNLFTKTVDVVSGPTATKCKSYTFANYVAFAWQRDEEDNSDDEEANSAPAQTTVRRSTPAELPKITKLTPEQEAKVEEYYQLGLKIGWCTDRSDRAKAEEGMNEIYDRLGKPRPEYVWVDSPAAAQDYILADGGDWSGMSGCEGQFEAYWVVFYDFCRVELKQTLPDSDGVMHLIEVKYSDDDNKHLDTWKKLMESTGHCFPFTKQCIMTERATIAKHDDQHRLHSEDGPALAYLDGFSIYSLNGITVPEKVIMRPWDLTLAEIEGEKNADVQTIMQDRWCYNEKDSAGDYKGSGGGRYLKETGAKTIHMDVYTGYKNEQGDDVQLNRALLEDKNGHKYLMCCDSSTDRVYYIRAADNCKTCEEAHMSFNGGVKDSDIVVSA